MTEKVNAKTFFLKPEQIDRLIEDPRACLATDRIVVDGAPVGYMYRDASSADEDSGWRFMAGDETSEYMADSENIGVYSLNSIANYDEDIIALLQSPVGAYFAREEAGEPFVRLVDPSRDLADPEIHPDYPVVEDDYQVTEDWMLTLPLPCNRRIEDGSMVLWRPGLTVHLVAWDNTPGDSIADRVTQLLDSVTDSATDLQRRDEEGLSRVSYRLDEDGVDTIATFMVSERSQMLAQIYFDDEDGRAMAQDIAASIRPFEDGDQPNQPESTDV